MSPISPHGATAHRLGPRLKGIALALHYDQGLPVRKVPGVIRTLTGIELTQGALTQCAGKLSERSARRAYSGLVGDVPKAPVVYTDDTGWRIGGKPAWLMGFQTSDSTVFQICRRHRNNEVRRVIPGDYRGIVSTDRGVSYDAKPLAAVRQNKCCHHLRRSIQQAMTGQKPTSQTVGANLLAVFEEAMAVWRDLKSGRLSQADYATHGPRLKTELTRLLRPRKLRNRANQTLINELGWHHERGNLLRFLDHPEVEPTNNRAERMLRGAVIARKISHCWRNDRGAHAYATLKSIATTAAQRAIPPHEAFARLIQAADPFLPRAPTLG